MCNWGDNVAIWVFVPMCLYMVQAQRLGCTGEPSWAIWTKLSFCHIAFMSTWWKENANSRRSSNSFHNFQHPGGSWELWPYSHCSNGNLKQVPRVPSLAPSPKRPCFFSSWVDELSFLASAHIQWNKWLTHMQSKPFIEHRWGGGEC